MLLPGYPNKPYPKNYLTVDRLLFILASKAYSAFEIYYSLTRSGRNMVLLLYVIWSGPIGEQMVVS